MDRKTRLLCSGHYYSVEAWKRRTTNASARNPIPKTTSATDSSVLGDCVSCDNWTLPNLITASAGRAKIAEMTATNEATNSTLTQSLLAKIPSLRDRAAAQT